MKKILMILMAIVAVSITSPTFAAKRSIMELPLFEREVLLIKKFETMHKPKHWPDYSLKSFIGLSLAFLLRFTACISDNRIFFILLDIKWSLI